jgi:G3E family GTPase
VTPIPLTVLGGFLGAGKTTLVNHLLRAELDRRVAVLVNDFGAIDIDAELITARDGETLSLANGCVCCSLAGGLMKTLLDLRRRPEPPERLLIEASGVADPWKIAQIGLAGRAYRLDAVIVLVDAETVRERASDPHIGATVRRQLAVADLLVLNKCDRVDDRQRAAVFDWLAGQVPEARIVETVQAELPPALILGQSLRRATRPTDELENSHQAQFHSFSFTADRPFEAAALRRLLADLPPGVLRAKGLVWLDETPERCHVLQWVAGRGSLTPDTPWGERNPGSRLVVLGQASGFDPQALEARFRAALRGDFSF